jgi:two-component system CheB/CheR fusion protein
MIDLTFHALAQTQAELHQTNEKLAESFRRLEAEQARKESFYIHAAHELRTPLAALKTRLYIMTRRPEPLKEHIETLDGTVDEMTVLVDELLEISRLSRGVVRLDREPQQLQKLLEEAVQATQLYAFKSKVDLVLRMDEGAQYVLGDGDRLKQAMNGLLTNAVNQTPAGERVEVILSASEAGKALLRVLGGSAVLRRQGAEIFQPFHLPTQGNAAGSRLSLTIAKEIIEMHDGTISAGVDGALFTVRLALAEPVSTARSA